MHQTHRSGILYSSEVGQLCISYCVAILTNLLLLIRVCVTLYNTILFDLNVNLFLILGFIGSLFSMLQFVASPFIGAASDVYGRKPMLLLSMVSRLLNSVNVSSLFIY